MLLNFDSVRRRTRPANMTPVRRAPAGALVIGLVNNMPPAAAQTTEWQFRALLEAASPDRPVQLRCFIPPALRAATGDWSCSGEYHEDLDAIWDADLDGLIVTGAEPRASDIADEPFWPLLASLVDWAADRPLFSIWSCLAAHAAVMRLDDLPRQPFPTKMSGVFECVKAADHPLLQRLPARWLVPHSRCNDVDEPSLVEQGYTILSRVPGVGADCFTRQAGNGRFLMLHGHPEYDADCLLREYRRDVKRFLAGRRAIYPLPPANYFDAATEAALAGLREQALQRPAASLLGRLDSIVDLGNVQGWRDPAIQLYAGWLATITDQKSAHRAAPAATSHNWRETPALVNP